MIKIELIPLVNGICFSPNLIFCFSLNIILLFNSSANGDAVVVFLAACFIFFFLNS